MQQVYRILRDNKEKGPFNLEELLQLSLKPFDLIWVEGRSAGWRYPSEIDSLKPYLEGADLQKDLSTAQRQVHPASQNTRPVINNAAPSIPQAITTEAAAPGEEEEMTAEKLERKAAEIYMRVQAYAQKAEQQGEGVQTKYARSLDDLKQEYADWLHKKKDKKKFALPGKRTALAVLASCVLVICCAWYLMSGTQKPAVALALKKEPAVVQGAAFIPEPPAKNKSYQPARDKITVAAPSPRVHDQLCVDAFIDSVERVMSRTSHSLPVVRKARKPDTNATYAAKEEELTTKATPVPAPTFEKKVQSTGPLVKMDAHYLQESNRKNIASLEVTIRNNGDNLLRTVTVDVFYYKKGERLFDKETLYFNNIQPGNSLTVSKPANKKAVSARFQLGQVIVPEN